MLYAAIGAIVYTLVSPHRCDYKGSRTQVINDLLLWKLLKFHST